MDIPHLLDPRVLLITGKGGVGKSTVAATVALAGARSGRRTCLVELEGRQTFSRLFNTQAWDYTEREFRPNLFGLAIDPEDSLREYLDLFYGARRFSRLVASSSAAEFATTAAPGIRDVLLLGKVKEMEGRRDTDGRLHYDLVVVDAPPTGRIVNFLRAPEATIELVGMGPIRTQAQMLVDMLLDPRRTNVVLVTLLEEMPVQETVESVHALRDVGVELGPTIVNRVLEEAFEPDARKVVEAGLEPDELQSLLSAAGLELAEDGAQGLLELGERHLHRLELQERMREALAQRLHLPTLEIPYIHSETFGEHEIDRLTAAIERTVGGR